jgi:transposase
MPVPADTREAILAARGVGEKLHLIARRLGVGFDLVQRVLRQGRKAGDARAALRISPRGAHTEAVLEARGEGASEIEIAARLGLHPGSVACIVWRARQAGDPRAAKISGDRRAANRARAMAARQARLAAKGAGPQRPAPSPQACCSHDAASVPLATPPALHAPLTLTGRDHAAEGVRGGNQSMRGLAQSVRAPTRIGRVCDVG